MPNPTKTGDAANKAYVDNMVNGMSWKDAVECATTTNGDINTAFSAGQSIDGYTLSAGDRILIKNQATASQNGIFVVQPSGPPLVAPDGTTGNLVTNTTVRINNGTVNDDTAWTLTTTGTITVGATPQTWVQTNAGSPFTAGAGLALASGVFSVKPGLGILADSFTGTKIDTTVVVRKYSIAIGDGVNTSYTITHNFGVSPVVVQVYDTSNGELVDVDVISSNPMSVTLGFATPPSAAAFTVVIHG